MSCKPTAEQSKLQAIKGRIARDGLTGRDGEVMDLISGQAYLRPLGGGIEWTTPLACVSITDPPPNP